MTHFPPCALQIPPMWSGCTQTCSRQTTASSCTIPTRCLLCPGQSWRRLISPWSIISPRCVCACVCDVLTTQKTPKTCIIINILKVRIRIIVVSRPHRNAATSSNSWTTPTLRRRLRSWRARPRLKAAKNCCRSSTPPCSSVTCT